jgi:hypothetical protein
VGLRGSFAYKEPRKRWNNPQAFPIRKLYLNLRNASKDESRDVLYDFRFFTDKEAETTDPVTYWFRVSNILDIDAQFHVNEYLIANGLMDGDKKAAKFANQTLFKLWSVVHESRVINYFLEEDEHLDKVLNIFIRVNNGGTILSYSDLLLSIAAAQWTKHDARETITAFVDEINRVGDGFDFDKDWALKSCLVLCDFTEIAFKVDNFNKANMLRIETEWDDISRALTTAVILISSFGYSRETLTSNNAVIPIAYHLLIERVNQEIRRRTKSCASSRRPRAVCISCGRSPRSSTRRGLKRCGISIWICGKSIRSCCVGTWRRRPAGEVIGDGRA